MKKLRMIFEAITIYLLAMLGTNATHASTDPFIKCRVNEVVKIISTDEQGIEVSSFELGDQLLLQPITLKYPKSKDKGETKAEIVSLRGDQFLLTVRTFLKENLTLAINIEPLNGLNVGIVATTFVPQRPQDLSLILQSAPLHVNCIGQ